MKKTIASALLSVSIFTMVQPVQAHGSFLIALLIWDHNSCWLNWFWGCPGDGGGAARPGGPQVGDVCVSAPNVCEDVAPGTIQPDGTCSAVTPPDDECIPCESDPNICGMRGSGYMVGDVCKAVIPSGSLCPPELDEGGELTAWPSRFIEAVGDTAELTWSVKYATECSLSINGGVGQVVPTSTVSGGFVTPPLMRPANDLTLRCFNTDPANSASWTIRVMVNPRPVEF